MNRPWLGTNGPAVSVADHRRMARAHDRKDRAGNVPGNVGPRDAARRARWMREEEGFEGPVNIAELQWLPNGGVSQRNRMRKAAANRCFHCRPTAAPEPFQSRPTALFTIGCRITKTCRSPAFRRSGRRLTQCGWRLFRRGSALLPTSTRRTAANMFEYTSTRVSRGSWGPLSE